MDLRRVKCFAEKAIAKSVKKPVKKAEALVLSFLMVFGLASCGTSEVRTAEKLECDTWETAELTLTEAGCPVGWEKCVWDFSLGLLAGGFEESKDEAVGGGEYGQSIVISPLSALQVMLMICEGADGETREQIVDSVGAEVLLEIEEIQELLNRSEDGLTVSSANSAWFRDEEGRLAVSDKYVGILQKYFDAESYLAPFDKSTISDINAWCDEKTGGRIDKMIEKISDDAVIYLLNALTFDAEWEFPYESYNVHDCDFKHEDGSVETVEMMYDRESLYLENEFAKGFVKPYKGDCSFAVLLPKDENMKMSDFLALLDADAVSSISPQRTMLETGIPKFKTECDFEMKQVLESMGIRDLFDDEKAELSNMATSSNGNIFVSQIKQKAVIETDTEGTRAAAVTVAEMVDGTSLIEESLYLDRPFVYAIVDDETQVPIFMGVMMGNEA